MQIENIFKEKKHVLPKCPMHVPSDFGEIDVLFRSYPPLNQTKKKVTKKNIHENNFCSNFSFDLKSAVKVTGNLDNNCGSLF